MEKLDDWIEGGRFGKEAKKHLLKMMERDGFERIWVYCRRLLMKAIKDDMEKDHPHKAG